ncbi:hypothetical protein BKH46_09190 [Helicobacter sp. 12S02634-8]|nr:hypothetical protein BKH46_09190 [Helicobacter sp. 12S02634-8]
MVMFCVRLINFLKISIICIVPIICFLGIVFAWSATMQDILDSVFVYTIAGIVFFGIPFYWLLLLVQRIIIAFYDNEKEFWNISQYAPNI